MATLVRCLGASALPFCDFLVFTGPVWLVHCDACSTQVKPRAAKSRDISWVARSSLCSALRLPMHVEHVPRCTCCTGPAKQNGSAPVPGSQIGVATSSVLLTISDSIFKVFTVKKQIRMCNYKIFYGNYFDIHFQYRQKVYIIGISRYGDIFSMTIPAISADWNIVKKTIYRNTDGA